MFVLNVFLPLAMLSIARKRMDYFTFNPWLSNLSDYLASYPDPWSKKLAFPSDMAPAWFISNSPIEGVEWGFIIDVPSVVRFLLTSLLFGAYFALWVSTAGTRFAAAPRERTWVDMPERRER